MSKLPRVNRTTPSRFLPALMLLVLLGALGAAWLLSRTPAHGIASATDIIADIRNRGLDDFWSTEPVAYWYIIRRNDQPIGWSVSYREGEEGGFRGTSVQVVRMPQGQIHEAQSSWWLNLDATKGTYSAQSGHVSLAGGLRASRDSIEVRFQNGQLTIVQRLGNQEVVSGAPMPPGYIPDGLRPLALAMTARKKTEALFRMIGDNIPPSGEYPRFLRLNMKYLSPPPDHANQAMIELTESLEGASFPPEIYVLDREGIILREERIVGDQKVVYTRSSEADVSRIFPEAIPTIRRLRERAEAAD